LGLCAKRSGPRPVDRAVDGDPVQPRTERAAVVEAVERAHGRKEGLLRDVLRGCGVVDDEIRGAVGAGPMLAKEGLEVRDRSSLSAPDPRALAPGEARHRALTIRANSLTRSIRRRDLARSNARISGSPRKEPAVKRLAVLLAFAFLPTAVAHADGCPASTCGTTSQAVPGAKLLFVRPSGQSGPLIAYDLARRVRSFALPAGTLTADTRSFF